ncbi:IS630 family transposase [Rhizophagus irregularis DAOM 181602=DAOM 197198]|nr:IS630 family transposase [Rhizophagus irregularis DAOM 181602=DAOM 197198]
MQILALTLKTRGAIIYGYDCRHSCRTIAKQLGCEKSTVNKIIKCFHETHSLTPKKQSGRPPLFDLPAQQKLKAFVKENSENRQLCSTKLATVWTAQIKQSISHSTIRRNLKKVGLTACVPRHKPAMTEAHRQAHLKWAYKHENWMREPGEELNPDCIAVTVKHITGQTHVKVINDYVVPTLHRYFPRGNGIFQEDNAVPHCAKVAVFTRKNAGIMMLGPVTRSQSN